jgi:glycosyltransferase involved in cell wall biosynthesis
MADTAPPGAELDSLPAFQKNSSRKTMRVLAMLEAASVTGSAKSVLEFAAEANKRHEGGRAFEVSVLTFRRGEESAENSLTSALRQAGAEVDIIRERRRFDTRILSQLRNAAEARRPDVIWSHSLKSHFLVRLAGLHRNHCWIAFHHGYTATDAKMKLYNQFDRWSLKAAARVMTVCQPFADELAGIGVPRERIRVQHMPVRPPPPVPEEELRELRRRYAISDETRVLLNVGRLSREKGHVELLRAFTEIRREFAPGMVRLLLVGEGVERSRIENVRRELKLEPGVTLAGHQENIQAYYRLADALVLSSHSEGSPNVLLEAMAAGLPVAATAVGGVPELARDNEDALLVRSGDIGALAGAVLRLLRETDLARRLSDRARGVIVRHAPELYFQSVASILEESLGR